MEAELPQGEIYPERKKMHTHSSLSYALSSSPANHDGQNLLAAFQTEKGEQTLLCKYCNKPLMVHGLVQTSLMAHSLVQTSEENGVFGRKNTRETRVEELTGGGGDACYSKNREGKSWVGGICFSNKYIPLG